MVINAKNSKIIVKKKGTFNIFVKLAVKSLGFSNKAKHFCKFVHRFRS